MSNKTIEYKPKEDLNFYAAPESSKSIHKYLIEGIDFNVPDVHLDPEQYAIPDDLFKGAMPKVGIDDFTTIKKGDLTSKAPKVGEGVFDKMMASVAEHLKVEYNNSRITGTEYAKVYEAAVANVLAQAVQFCLNKDQAYWNAVTARMQAATASVGLYNAQVQLAIAKAQAHTAAAQYSGTIIKLATEDVQFKAAQNNLRLQEEQIISAHEQAEAYHAQTAENRIDNQSLVAGSVGKQKELYTAQIDAYQKESQLKAVKVFTDILTTQLATNENLDLPENIKKVNIDNILTKFKENQV